MWRPQWLPHYYYIRGNVFFTLLVILDDAGLLHFLPHYGNLTVEMFQEPDHEIS